MLPQQAGTLSRVGYISKTYLPINFSGSPNCSSMGSILLPVMCTLAGVVNNCAAPPRGKLCHTKGIHLHLVMKEGGVVKKSEVRRGAASASVDHAVKALAGRLTRGECWQVNESPLSWWF